MKNKLIFLLFIALMVSLLYSNYVNDKAEKHKRMFIEESMRYENLVLRSR